MGYSKLKIPKVCECCKKPFEAKTVLTRFCSTQCVNKADRTRKKEAKEETKFQAEKAQKTEVIADIQSRPYISIPEATLLFGISKDTLRRLIKSGKIPAHNLGQRFTSNLCSFQLLCPNRYLNHQKSIRPKTAIQLARFKRSLVYQTKPYTWQSNG